MASCSKTAGSSIFTDEAMTTEFDSRENNPPTLSDNINTDAQQSVEITDQNTMDHVNDSDCNENSEIETDVSNDSDSQEVELSEVFYYNPNTNRTYDATSEFSDIEDDNQN